MKIHHSLSILLLTSLSTPSFATDYTSTIDSFRNTCGDATNSDAASCDAPDITDIPACSASGKLTLTVEDNGDLGGTSEYLELKIENIIDSGILWNGDIADNTFETSTANEGTEGDNVAKLATYDIPDDDLSTIVADGSISNIHIDTKAVGLGNMGKLTLKLTILPSVSITATKADAKEAGPVNGEFTIERTGCTTDALNVTINISGTATNSTDYNTISTTITIPAGESSVKIPVEVIDDAVFEDPENVIVTIEEEETYFVAFRGAPNEATVTITDNDTTVTIEATTSTASEEGETTGVFTITRDGDTTNDLEVTLDIGGNASDSTDYNHIDNPVTVTIPAGETSTTLEIKAIDDSIFDRNEKVTATIQESDTYKVDDNNTADINIIDNDPVPIVTIPTLSTWGLIFLSSLLGLIGLRRKKAI